MDRTEWEAFGQWVEMLRTRSGLAINELAQRAEVSVQWLQDIRKGGRGIYGEWRLPNPKDEALARLARALDVPVEEMLRRAGRATEVEEPVDEAPDSAAARIRELEERVAEHERQLADLQRRLKQSEGRTGTG
jgi:transcriptional regulator with XRE-family HTH domain